MNALLSKPPEVKSARAQGLHFIFHECFENPDAETEYGGAAADFDKSLGFMPDDVTRDLAQRMHYAGWRASKAATPREASGWRRLYLEHRDRIVLGNRKLTYRAVQKWSFGSPFADDMAGECQIVLIKAVASFNPWLGIRFSTYAFTCLIRALSRHSQRQAADRLCRSLPLEALRSAEPCYIQRDQPSGTRLARLGEYFRDGDTLLTSREKLVLSRRFQMNGEASNTETLEEVGRDLGLSKERVRQVQKLALGKLRDALLSATSA